MELRRHRCKGSVLQIGVAAVLVTLSLVMEAFSPFNLLGLDRVHADSTITLSPFAARAQRIIDTNATNIVRHAHAEFAATMTTLLLSCLCFFCLLGAPSGI